MDADPGRDDNREHRKRLRQKFLTAGMGAFHEYEVVEFLLTFAIPEKTSNPRRRSSSGSSAPSRGSLMRRSAIWRESAGWETESAIVIKFIRELATLYLKQKAKEKPQIACTSELLDFCKTAMGGKKTRSSA